MSPAPDISRYKLKQLAHWIRDGLDVLVAREGPDSLRPDDVVVLHELFVVLRQSTTITAGDLRATGIHKAVKDIAGIATRWPGRLCDDCDMIIAIWTDKFGPLDELRPFLYGRGGRLEGIATVAEVDRRALLKRWTQHCPDKIDPSVSHRQGSLGFTAGDWWINPLFAHHAGIIGLESIEGGTTYDHDGAYALVLKEASEIAVRDDDCFTYLCPSSDRGRFRLTAATATSRRPIRVLRNSGVNSTWGPKAGTRYEGLYSVKGWCIRQAKVHEILSKQWREGDILYEVMLQRNDPVPMDEVASRPTNMELDDYAEYKRLRKLHRADQRNALGLLPAPLKMIPITPPTQPTANTAVTPQSLPRTSPNLSRKTTFKKMVFNAPSSSQNPERSPTTEIVSPKTVPDLQDPMLMPQRTSVQGMPMYGRTHNVEDSSSDGFISTASPGDQAWNSLPESTRSAAEDLKEITPWIELAAERATLSSLNSSAVLRQQNSSTAIDELGAKAAALNPVKSVRRLAGDPRQQRNLSLQTQDAGGQDAGADALDLGLYTAKPIFGKKEGREKEWHPKKTILAQKLKFLDGAKYSIDDEDIGYYTSSLYLQRPQPSPIDAIPHLELPTSIGPSTPWNLYNHGIEDIEFPSLTNNLISRPRVASPVSSFKSTPLTHPESGRLAGESIATGRLKRWLSK